MRTTAISRVMTLGATAALLAACGSKPVLPFALPFLSPTSTLTPTSTPVPPTGTPRAGGLCSNPLVPVKPGATWTYVVDASGAEGPSGFSTTISDVRPEGFTMAVKWGENMTTNQEWACRPEGLLALSPAAGERLLGLSWQGIKADLQTSNAAGVTVPADVKPGGQWVYLLDLAGNVAQGSLGAKLSGTVSTTIRTIGTEPVTVPAGTFQAVKIQAISSFRLVTDFGALRLPMNSVVSSTFWFAPGIGWIQSSVSGEWAGTALSATTQLQSYDVP